MSDGDRPHRPTACGLPVADCSATKRRLTCEHKALKTMHETVSHQIRQGIVNLNASLHDVTRETSKLARKFMRGLQTGTFVHKHAEDRRGPHIRVK